MICMLSKIQVDGMANQFSGIDQSYMSVDFHFPETQMAGLVVTVIIQERGTNPNSGVP